MNEHAPSPWIITTDDSRFDEDVFQASHHQLVLVDFWADWCQPCRMLAPILERLAQHYAGKFLLVKANTDQNPQAATQFAVQSIPVVFAVRNGQVVDFFQGAIPENHLRAWIDRNLPTATDLLIEEAEKLLVVDPENAEKKLLAALALEPESAPALTHLTQLLLDQGRLAEAQQQIDKLAARGFLEPAAERLKAQLELRQLARSSDLNALRDAAQQAPQDVDAQLKLVEGLAACQQYEAALEHGLSVVQNHRGAPAERARQVMVDIFRVLPDDSPLTSTYRRRLAQALY